MCVCVCVCVFVCSNGWIAKRIRPKRVRMNSEGSQGKRPVGAQEEDFSFPPSGLPSTRLNGEGSLKSGEKSAPDREEHHLLAPHPGVPVPGDGPADAETLALQQRQFSTAFSGPPEETEPAGTSASKKTDKVKKLCAEADREWRKNIKRKICDASVVTEQIAEHAIKLLREHSMKAATKNNSVAVTLVDKSELDKLSKDKDICAIAEQRMANLANKATLLILERLMSHKWAWLFNEPVNADELNLKDYHKIVKKPMALSIVKNRAQMGLYKTVSEAASDIRLVFENAQLYNKPGSDVNIMASAMLEKFEELWQSKVTQKFNEEETLARHEESVARKKKVDALRAQQNGEFRQKCQSYERLLCDVENFLVDVQQQIIVSCKPLASEKRKRAQALIQETAFEKTKPALAVILQRYPEMLNTSTQEVEVDLSKVDPLTLRQVLMLLEQANSSKEDSTLPQNTSIGSHSNHKGEVEREFNCWINAMTLLVKQKRRRSSSAGKAKPSEENRMGDNSRGGVDIIN